MIKKNTKYIPIIISAGLPAIAILIRICYMPKNTDIILFSVLLSFAVSLVVLSITVAIKFDKIEKEKHTDIQELKKVYGIFSALITIKYPSGNETKRADDLLNQIPLYQSILEKYLINKDKLDELLILIREKPVIEETNDEFMGHSTHEYSASWKTDTWNNIITAVTILKDELNQQLKKENNP